MLMCSLVLTNIAFLYMISAQFRARLTMKESGNSPIREQALIHAD
jgi:hypothetical protein